MTPIQQIFLGSGGAAKKKYIDDVFNTFLYTGDNGSDRHVDNGMDINGEGGLVWVDKRTGSSWGSIYVADTARGLSDQIFTAKSDAQSEGLARIKAASGSNTGFNVGSDSDVNSSSNNYCSWTWLKSKGFFDVVKYTGNGTAGHSISHSLGSKPGMIFIKNIDAGENWRGQHRELGATHNIEINNNQAAGASTTAFNNTEPTASVFTLGTDGATNGNGQEHVAYLFAGGESTAATARSVDFDGSGDYVKFEAASSGIAVGTGNFTCEFWVKLNADVTGNDALIDTRTSAMNTTNGFQIYLGSNRAVYGYAYGDMFGSTTKILNVGTWHHIAVVRPAENVIWLYVDGTRVGNQYGNDMTFSNSEMVVGANAAGGTESNVKISNLRLTKGQALYTSSFRPSTEPLTTTSQGATASNVKILAFNNSSVTGGTVVPTVTSNGDPTASTDSPFDDPAAFKFGENEDQNVVKCGSYVGNGSTTGPEINLGWEPQWVLIKRTTYSENWALHDCMRGLVTDGDDMRTRPDSGGSDIEVSAVDLTSTGFKITTTLNEYNHSTDKYIYLAIRRPDGYVGKPAEVGTDVFALATGRSDNVKPTFTSGFPVDLNFYRTTTNSSWVTHARLLGKSILYTDSDGSQQASSNYEFDHNTGMGNWTGNQSVYKSWLWKRHAGFDVVAYKGNNKNGRQIPHSLSKTPEMIWIKNRKSSTAWVVGHKALDGGNEPWTHYLELNTTNAESDYPFFNDTPPTSTHFTVHSNDATNGDGASEDYIAMLFASVDGISKVGSFVGSNSTVTVTTGFQPRFVIIKLYSGGIGNWNVLDTTRGWGSGNDNYLLLNDTAAQGSHNVGAPTSTGFTVDTAGSFNEAGKNYIYYAHA